MRKDSSKGLMWVCITVDPENGTDVRYFETERDALCLATIEEESCEPGDRVSILVCRITEQRGKLWWRSRLEIDGAEDCP